MKNQKSPIYKIYSRKRLRLGLNKNRFKMKKITALLIVLLIIFAFCYSLWQSINPIFKRLCEDEARAIATEITNEETSRVMNKYSYNSFFTIEKDESGNVQMITANVLQINQITSDIALYIQKALKNSETNEIYISTGSLTGSKILSGYGPKLPIRISDVGNVSTDLKSEFVAQGVNQTLHRIYLNIITEVSILTPFMTIQTDINNQVLIAENLIVGEIPDTYYNLNAFENGTDLLEVVE